MMTKLVLIDGFAVMHRAYHALPPLTTTLNEPINAVYGLISMLLRVITDIKPTHIAVAFDEKEKTFRQIKYAAYQSQRPQMDNELASQFDKARKFIKAAKIPLYSKSGFEADDVIGTIASNVDGEVVIVTGDRDILQLVTDKVKLYMPVKGFNESKLYGEAETIERMGVPPKQIANYKALVGDPSDNYPGVAGVGPKTAISLLEKYKTLDNIYKNLDELAPKLSLKLTENKENAYMSLHLATIVKDVPVKWDIKDAQNWDIDGPQVLQLFQEFGFKTLTERVKKVGQELDEEKQGSLF